MEPTASAHGRGQPARQALIGSAVAAWALLDSALHPEYVTRHFERLARNGGLPPIRLHDLRHGAATLALAGGADLKTVSEMLGHSTITITADTYRACCPRWRTGPRRSPPASFRACSPQNPRRPAPSRPHLAPKTTPAPRPRGTEGQDMGVRREGLEPPTR